MGAIDRAVLDHLLNGGDPADLDHVVDQVREALAEALADAIDEYRHDADG